VQLDQQVAKVFEERLVQQVQQAQLVQPEQLVRLA
jgi:hypothetical protein